MGASLVNIPDEVAHDIARAVRLERAFGSNETVIEITVRERLIALTEPMACGWFRWRRFEQVDDTEFPPVAAPAGQRSDEPHTAVQVQAIEGAA